MSVESCKAAAPDSESRPIDSIFGLERWRRPALCCAASAILAAIAPAAWSQEPPAQPTQQSDPSGSNVTPYLPAFFAQFRPNTALDMIGRIPGFSFDGGSFARGFSGTAGNVLIDGERPPSRNDSLGSVLSRIPATAVIRIDVIRGGAEGIDMQGKPIVANVIRKPDAGVTGAVSGGVNMNTRGDGNINGTIQVQDQRDGRLLEGSLSGGKRNRKRRQLSPAHRPLPRRHSRGGIAVGTGVPESVGNRRLRDDPVGRQVPHQRQGRPLRRQIRIGRDAGHSRGRSAD